MRKAVELAKTTCNCTPWFLKINGSVCDPIGLTCFDNITSNFKESDNTEQCLPECVSAEYDLTFREMTAIESDKSSFGEEWKHFFSDDNPMYYSSKNGPVYRMIHINYIRKKATVIIKDAKVTFADMLGNIGGTLGVFIGLSFVGLLDFILWILAWVKEMWSIKRK